MVKINKIYTRTGDDGSTGLVDGSRRLKCDLRVEAYGAIDETNAAIGIARCYCGDDTVLDPILMRIQNDLFDLGSDLAMPPQEDETNLSLRIIASQVERLEHEIDLLNADIAPLKSFILPGGGKAAAFLHQARTIARRAERVMVALTRTEDVNPLAIHYVNRLSDLLFIASRYTNAKGLEDVLWVPGENR